MVLDRHYEVLSTLGEGAFGKVYKAKHRETGEEVAAKEIKVGSASFDEACNSMELKALKALRHPCVVRLRELLRSQKDGSLFFIFEFVPSDLCCLIRESPNGLAEAQAIELMRQLLVGITHIHQHGFFHRDIKPANILFDPERQAIRIADFGETRSLRARPPFTDYVGTRWYRAPECLLRNNNYSSPVDVWAAGLVFAELLRGSPVFAGSSAIDQLQKIFVVFGVPAHGDWPEFKQLSGAIRFHVDQGACGVQHVLPSVSLEVQAAVSEILILNPMKRPPARRCLEQLEIFAKLPPVDFNRMESICLTAPVPSRLEEEQTLFPEQTDSTRLAITPSPCASQRGSCSWEMHQGVDLDAELDEILGDSPEQVLNAPEFRPTSPSSGMDAILASLPAAPSPEFRPTSPTGGMDAILASLEADLQ